MGAAVSITRLDLTASELRQEASVEKNGAAARRILALALVLGGMDRKTAAETCGMDRQTLRDWVHRYNAAERRRQGISRSLCAAGPPVHGRNTGRTSLPLRAGLDFRYTQAYEFLRDKSESQREPCPLLQQAAKSC